MRRLGTRSTREHWQILPRRKSAPLPRLRPCRAPSALPPRRQGQACPARLPQPPSSPNCPATNPRLATRPRPPLKMLGGIYPCRRARYGPHRRPSRRRGGARGSAKFWIFDAFTGKRPRGARAGAAWVSGRSGFARSAAKSRPIDLPRAHHVAVGIFSSWIFARRRPRSRSGWPERNPLFHHRSWIGRSAHAALGERSRLIVRSQPIQSKPSLRCAYHQRCPRSFNRAKPCFRAKLPVRSGPAPTNHQRSNGFPASHFSIRIFARLRARNSGDSWRISVFPE